MTAKSASGGQTKSERGRGSGEPGCGDGGRDRVGEQTRKKTSGRHQTAAAARQRGRDCQDEAIQSPLPSSSACDSSRWRRAKGRDPAASGL